MVLLLDLEEKLELGLELGLLGVDVGEDGAKCARREGEGDHTDEHHDDAHDLLVPCAPRDVAEPHRRDRREREVERRNVKANIARVLVPVAYHPRFAVEVVQASHEDPAR